MESSYDDFKRKVQENSDIVDVISSYVSLQKKGRDYWACCPFHHEKTPSFSVSKEKQFFYCYGCHVGGDVFTFVEKMENCNFPDAVKRLAERAHIPIPERRMNAGDRKRAAERERLISANNMAVSYFSACLKKTEFGAEALKYLHDRGITDEIIDRFSLGAALTSPGSLRYNLTKKGAAVDDLFKAGLLRQRNGSFMDAFVGRVMIPIKDARGRVVAFGGRVLGDGLPKYLNTGETVIFQKRSTLFGLDVALRHIREQGFAIVVEGYMDVISLQAAGVKNVVASLGTAFSEEHARMIKRIVPELIMAYDGDDAGKRNTVRAVSIAAGAGLNVKVLQIKGGADPDDFIRKNGKAAFDDLVKKAVDGKRFQINYLLSKEDLSTLEGKKRVVSNIVPYIAGYDGNFVRDKYIRDLAKELFVEEGFIREELNAYNKNKGGGAAFQPVNKGVDVNFLPDIRVQAERKLLLLFSRYTELISAYETELFEIGFSNPARWSIFAKLVEAEGLEFQEVSRRLLSDEDGSVRNEMAQVLAKDDLAEADVKLCSKMISDCLKQIKEEILQLQYEEHSKLLSELAGDPERLEEARKELEICNDLRGKIKELYD